MSAFPCPVKKGRADAPDYGALQPAGVWKMFAELSAIPRPSYKEAAVQKRILELAAARNLATAQDSAGNVAIYVPSTPGYENRPPVVLQAHTDIVAVRREGKTTHDFERDPITLVTDIHGGEPVVHADHTTLGADNGIGAACALALMDARGAAHPRLELLLTVNEESGMTGAKALDPSLLAGRRMLNLDTEEDDTIYIGCAGGAAAFLAWNCALADAAPADAFRTLRIAGLRGGHSGMEIHQHRGNALQIAGHVLARLPRRAWSFASLDCGRFRNAIPSAATAVLALDAASLAALEREAKAAEEHFRAKLGEFGTDLRVTVEPAERAPIHGPVASAAIAALLHEAPYGVISMAENLPGTVETSNNVAIARTKREGDHSEIVVEVGIRSLLRPRLEEIRALWERIGASHGAAVTTTFGYPPWEPNPKSELLETARRTHVAAYRREPRVASIHAGLECGILCDRLGECDIVSIGPRIAEAHTPDERVYVQSVETFWKYLLALLAEL